MKIPTANYAQTSVVVLLGKTLLGLVDYVGIDSLSIDGYGYVQFKYRRLEVAPLHNGVKQRDLCLMRFKPGDFFGGSEEFRFRKVLALGFRKSWRCFKSISTD